MASNQSLSKINQNIEVIPTDTIKAAIDEILKEFNNEFKSLAQVAEALRYTGFDVELVRAEVYKLIKDKNKAEVASDLTTICMLAVMRGNNIDKVIEKTGSAPVKAKLIQIKNTFNLKGPGSGQLTPYTLTPVRVSLAFWQISLACAARNPSPNITPDVLLSVVVSLGAQVKENIGFPSFIMTNAFTSCSVHCLTQLHKVWLIINNLNLQGIPTSVLSTEDGLVAILASWSQIMKFYNQAISKPVLKEDLVMAIARFSDKRFDDRIAEWKVTEEKLAEMFKRMSEDPELIKRAAEMKDMWGGRRAPKPAPRSSSRMNI